MFIEPQFITSSNMTKVVSYKCLMKLVGTGTRSQFCCLPPTKEEVYVFACTPELVCLSVCVQDYSKTRAWICMKCYVSTDVGTWTNLLIFEPDPDRSPDPGTGFLPPISYNAM